MTPHKKFLYFLLGTRRSKKKDIDILTSEMPTVTMSEWYYEHQQSSSSQREQSSNFCQFRESYELPMPLNRCISR